MKRAATAVILLASLVLGTTASARVDAPSSTSATTLTVWVGWSARELSEFKKVAAEYDRKNAAVEVKVVGGINDDKIIAALRGGNAPDVVSSFTSSNVGIYCPSGGWIDLAPYMKKDGIKESLFPAATMYYTQYKGKRCALPLLADVYGFYYNKAMFKAAGIKGPPKTLGELTAVAKKLTTKNAGRVAEGRRLQPVLRLLPEHRRRLPAERERQVVRLAGQVEPLEGPAVVEAAALAEEPDRLLRAQEPRQVERGRRRRVLGLARVRDGQARDDDGRRVAGRLHCGRASRAPVRDRADAGRVVAARPATAPATSTARSSASRRAPRTRTRPGRSSST